MPQGAHLRVLNMKKPIYLALLLTACVTHEYGTTYLGIDFLSKSEIALAVVKPDFEKHVKPILEVRCVDCHNQQALPGKLNLTDRRSALTPTSTGHIAIVPYHPEHSPLLGRIDQAHGHLSSMPPVGEKITKNEVAILKQWIALGAPWPAGKSGKLRVREVR